MAVFSSQMSNSDAIHKKESPTDLGQLDIFLLSVENRLDITKGDTPHFEAILLRHLNSLFRNSDIPSHCLDPVPVTHICSHRH